MNQQVLKIEEKIPNVRKARFFADCIIYEKSGFFLAEITNVVCIRGILATDGEKEIDITHQFSLDYIVNDLVIKSLEKKLKKKVEIIQKNAANVESERDTIKECVTIAKTADNEFAMRTVGAKFFKITEELAESYKGKAHFVSTDQTCEELLKSQTI